MEKKESRETEGGNGGIQHLSHNHRLTLDEDNKAEGVLCYGCLQPISSGPVYTCTPCHFFLHKFCAELPEKLTMHPFHVEHQLSLLPRTDPNRNYYKCDICRQVRATEFCYYCDGCDFYVDIKCASIKIKTQQKPMETEHGSHKHKLLRIEKSSKLLCDVCGRKHEGSSSYLCTECGFWENRECPFLPPTIRLSGDHHHDHDLTLTHPLPDEYDEFPCKICSGSLHRNQWVYSCSKCMYFFIHIKCRPASSVFKIQHLSHCHPLTLDEYNKAGGVRCEGCLQPISSGPVYTCTKCQFFLHKSCAELPKEITHPSHVDHQLFLLPRHGRYRNDYKCDICRRERPTEFSCATFAPENMKEVPFYALNVDSGSTKNVLSYPLLFDSVMVLTIMITISLSSILCHMNMTTNLAISVGRAYTEINGFTLVHNAAIFLST